LFGLVLSWKKQKQKQCESNTTESNLAKYSIGHNVFWMTKMVEAKTRSSTMVEAKTRSSTTDGQG